MTKYQLWAERAFSPLSKDSSGERLIFEAYLARVDMFEIERRIAALRHRNDQKSKNIQEYLEGAAVEAEERHKNIRGYLKEKYPQVGKDYE